MKKTMKGMMFKSGIIFCLIPFFFLWLSFAVSSTATLKKNMESEQKTIVRLLGTSVENYFYAMEEAMGKVTSDTEMLNILKNVDRNKYDSELYNAYQYFNKLIGKTCYSFQHVDNIIVTNMEGDCYSTKVVNEELSAFIQDMDKLKSDLYDHQGRTWITALEVSSDLILVKPIMDIQEIRYVGMMYFVIPENEMAALLRQDLAAEEAVLLVNGQDDRIYAENEEILEKEDTVITQSEENNYGLRVITGIAVSQYSDQLLRRQFQLFLIFVTATILLFISIQYIYKKINEEINRLLHPEEKAFTEETTFYEIRQLNHEMMSLVQKNNEGEKKIVKLMNHCETINLDKLQAQINPHFLYNTLTSIKYIAIENGQKQISELITALIKLLRSTINREGTFIPLSKELENVRNYMCIQNVIYKENVEFDIEIPEELLSCTVPNFILQPLVENCLFHGIHPEEKGGKIRLGASQTKEGLSITVSDNGDGFPEDCLVDMMGAENNKEMMTNFGLKGVQQKIQLMCGEAYGLRITSKKNLGSTVEIVLPYDMEKK